MNLKDIKIEIQQITDAIAKIIEANVTIVGKDLVRIAGTGPYGHFVWNDAPRGSAYDKVLKARETLFIESPGKDHWCCDCPIKAKCTETFEICTPIIWQDDVIGVMGVFAFDEKQKEKIVRKKNDYLRLLQGTSSLIASKLGEKILYEEIVAKNKELSAVIQNVNQGVLCLDREGRIKYVNPKALKLLEQQQHAHGLSGMHLNELWTSALILKAIKGDQEYLDHEDYYEARGVKKTFITTVKLLHKGESQVGAVATFSDVDEIEKSSFRIREKVSRFSFDSLIGNSPKMVNTVKRAKLVAGSESTILISGESGTGKELFARAIHNFSRADYPFVGINCSAIPESLLESELFGYEPGAFTGASKKGKLGKFELAHKGTLFLDEIGDMPLYLQAKLLRVLQEKQVVKLGGSKIRDTDIRVIAATNKNLEELINKQMFREDLYYRLNVIPLELPPLRERPEDIPVLIEHFIYYFNQKFNRQVKNFSENVMDFFLRYPWPGNVRELANVVEYGINIAEKDIICFDVIKDRFKISNMSVVEKGLREQVSEFERQTISKHLNQYGWDEKGKNKVARILQISRATLYRKISQI